MAKAKTYHDGAAEERKAFLRKLRRDLRIVGDRVAIQVLGALIEWVLMRHERYEKRKGGLGRKRKKAR